MGSVLETIRDKKVDWIREQVESFTRDAMQEYLENCRDYCSNMSLNPNHTKNFYDSVWGTIGINEGEILIIDSPILQRLRHIKQLGLADLLYSSADHSRFSHTLGVLQTADVMAGQIEKELKKKDVTTSAETRQIIRLAAIFHDCGHLFASHASERYYQKDRKNSLFQKIADTRLCFEANLKIEKPPLSEIISILIVNSPAVRALLDIIQKGLSSIDFSPINQDIIIEKICCMILGFPYTTGMIPFAQVISGPIDSDKLDYLKRDSHSTGVPVAVDMSRVFQKLRVVESSKSYKMIAVNDGKGKMAYKMAIAPAAINTVDQLVISRFMMYENIYYHQKTVTAEEMLRYAMHKLDSSTKEIFDDFSKVLRLTDNVVVHSDFFLSVKSVIKDFKMIDREEFNDACRILSNLHKRRLFKRCVAFTDENLTRVACRNREFYSRVIAGEVIEEQDWFIQTVIQEVKNIKRVLNGSEYPCHFNDTTEILLLITPDIAASSLHSNIAIADKKNKDRDAIFEADNWLRSRASRKPQNYLISYTEDRYIIYIAAEIVLLREYGLLINDTIIYTEEDEQYINQLKEYLDAKNYFRELYTLAPSDSIKAHEGDMQLLVEKWKSYEIFDVSTGEGINLDVTYLMMHIKQYKQFKKELGDFNTFLNGYFKMLHEMRLVSKEKIAKTLKGNLMKILNQEGCEPGAVQVCNIGNYQDSGAIIAYHVNIVNRCLGTSWVTITLEKALESAKPGQVIVFLEDAFCSGRQILSIFETYMGVTERLTNENHVEELTDDKKERLKNCRLYFSFLFYEQSNEEFFYRRLSEIGLKQVQIVAPEKFPEGYFKRAEKISDGEQMEFDTVKKYIKKAGEKLISLKACDRDGKRKPAWDDERMKKSVLGYNDAQQLIAFSWNTPTYTVTPLWMSADADNFQWVPLFPRIDK